MKTQHTKGPWIVRGHDESQGGSLIVSLSADIENDVASVYGGNEDEPLEREANARLIAAAPELLEALKDVYATKSLLMKQSPSEVELHECLKTFERVKEAIEKAIEG